jgi:tetratricopeptide (TPR) repeat protein
VRLGLLLVAGLVLSVAPVTIRNAVRSGQWVPISTNGGINLYIGNNPNASETVCIRPGTREWEALVALPYEEGDVASPSEAQSYFFRRVGVYLRQDPAGAVGGLLSKARQLINGREIPRNVDLYVFREHSRILGLLTWRWGPFAFPFGIIGPLALLGLVVAVRRRGEGRYLAGFVILYGLSLICFFPSSRYTVPMMPVILVLAFLGAGGLLALRTAPLRRRISTVALLLIGIAGVNLPVALPTDRVDFKPELHRHVGIGLQKRGRLGAALVQYGKALQADPAASDTHYYRGTALLAASRLDEAEPAFRTALSLQADYPEAMHDLAVVLHRQGRSGEAIVLLERAIELKPGYHGAMRNLAVALFAEGRREEAERWLRAAARRDGSPYPTQSVSLSGAR